MPAPCRVALATFILQDLWKHLPCCHPLGSIRCGFVLLLSSLSLQQEGEVPKDWQLVKIITISYEHPRPGCSECTCMRLGVRRAYGRRAGHSRLPLQRHCGRASRRQIWPLGLPSTLGVPRFTRPVRGVPSTQGGSCGHVSLAEGDWESCLSSRGACGYRRPPVTLALPCPVSHPPPPSRFLGPPLSEPFPSPPPLPRLCTG